MGIAKLLAPALFVAIIGASGTGHAAVNDVARFINQLGNQAIEVLRAPGLTLEQRESHFRSLLAEGFDLRFIGRFVLGKYWRMATPAQRNEYLALYGEFVLQTYSARLGGYAGQSLTVVDARQASDKDVVVRTNIDRPSGPPIIAEWRVRTTGGRFRIIDVAVEGISMAVTQRSEFAAVVQRDGIDGLLTILRARTTKLPATASLY
jgi:phospholipid transport system substrate-binding protein